MSIQSSSALDKPPKLRSSLGARLSRHWIALAIVVAFIGLSTIYSMVNPIFEAPDELFHYSVVKHIADGKGLPIQNPAKVSEFIGTEGSQPPLYYLIGAAATAWIDTGSFEQIAMINPSANIGGADQYDNKNKVMHRQSESFPYQGVPLAVHLIRFISVLMGTATVTLAYLMGLEVFGERRSLAAGVAAVVAFNPQFLFISGAVNNDNLITLLATFTLLLTIRAVKGKLSLASIVILIIVVSLAPLTKLSGLGTIGLAGIALLVGAWHKRSVLTFFAGGIAMVCLAAAVSGWWYLRNLNLYGDLLGFDAMAAMTGEKVGDRPNAWSILLNENEGLRRSFWSLFGWFNVSPDQIVYTVFDIIMVVAVLGIAIAIIKALITRKLTALPVYGVLVLWIAVVFVGYLRWATMVMASQGRLLFPAITAFSCLLVVGISNFAPGKLRWVPVGLVSLLMLAIATTMPFVTIEPAYAGATRTTVAELGTIPNPVHINFGDKMELLGYELTPESVIPGSRLNLTLYWRVLDNMDTDYTVYTHLLDADSKIIGQKDSYPAGGAFLTSELRPEQAFVYTDHLLLPADTKARGEGHIAVGLYDRRTMLRPPSTDATGTSVPTALTGTFKIVVAGQQ